MGAELRGWTLKATGDAGRLRKPPINQQGLKRFIGLIPQLCSFLQTRRPILGLSTQPLPEMDRECSWLQVQLKALEVCIYDHETVKSHFGL
jgi:hypothetical protein